MLHAHIAQQADLQNIVRAILDITGLGHTWTVGACLFANKTLHVI